jgi:hypothetical protein
MFRAASLPVIRSYLLYNWHWHIHINLEFSASVGFIEKLLGTVLRSPPNAVCPDLIIGLKVGFFFFVVFPHSFKVNCGLLP